MADLIKRTDTLNQGREKLNTAITDAETAKNISAQADDKATQALAKSEDTQTQLDTIVINGDSSVEAAQARVSTTGTAYGTLKQRLDSEYEEVTSQLAQTQAQKADVAYVNEKTQAVSLAYKESFATLAELQSAYPSGDIYNHVVLSDMMIYTYVNGAWTNTHIQANGTGIPANSISVDKLTTEVNEGLKGAFVNMFGYSNVPTAVNSNGFDYKIQTYREGSTLKGEWTVFGSFSDSYQVFPLIKGHKYYVRFVIDSDSVGRLSERVRVFYEDGTILDEGSRNIVPSNFVTSQIITSTLTGNANFTAVTNTAGNIVRVNQLAVDLTELYGLGNEPSKSEFEELLSNFPGYWFDNKATTGITQRSFFKDYVKFKNQYSSSKLLPSSVLQIETRTADKEILWYDIKRKIVYAVDAGIPNNQKFNLYASYDYGKTWKHIYTANSGIQDIFTLESGYHIIFTTNIRVRRVAPDFTSFNEFPALMRRPLSTDLGIADNGQGTIMFSQYHSADEIYNIMRSTDDGLTWHVALEGTMVKHWHSLQIDPYTGHWWACGGDVGEECRIIKSEDNGDTWQVMSSGSQQDRAVGLVFTQNEVIWGMDTAGGGTPKVMKANKTNFEPIEIGDVPLGTTTLGIAKTVDGYAFGWTRVEINSNQRESVVLWVTDGVNIKTIQQFAVKPEVTTGTSNAGFTHASLIDDENRWFGNASNTVMEGSFGFILPLNPFA